jgi:hypothetical protein
LQMDVMTAAEDARDAVLNLLTLGLAELTAAGARLSRILLGVLGACCAALCALAVCAVAAVALYALLYAVVVPTKLHAFPLHFVDSRCVTL